MRLTTDEIELLTGLTQPAAQVRALLAMGIRAERNRLGEVIVLRQWLDIDCRRMPAPEPELHL